MLIHHFDKSWQDQRYGVSFACVIDRFSFACVIDHSTSLYASDLCTHKFWSRIYEVIQCYYEVIQSVFELLVWMLFFCLRQLEFCNR